ncbi:MAG: gluzincin family metallopeptidase [Thermoanaerobaculia bacterium]
MANTDYPTPARRRLQVFAFDPLITQTAEAARYVTVDIANEPLLPGPQGSRIQVIDYDTAARTLYQPVDLDAPAVLMNGGLSPAESDPRFHQQMVYAVAMKVVENFELALGRKIAFHLGKRLRIFPHAFPGANAFYDPALVSILFGYFRADRDDPGGNLPGQNVFTCLSHDIIAHEVTHALMHLCARASTTRATATFSRFMRASPTSSRSFSTLLSATSSRRRSRRRAAICARRVR